MAKIKLSDYIAKRLKFHGVERFFMVSGGGAMHLNNSLGKAISYTCNHHEQACAISAEGYARVNQKLAVVNITTGPGGLNCLNGVFGQWCDSVPVLYISGQVKTSTMLDNCKLPTRQLGDQEVDIISVVKPLTKYCACVKNPLEIKYHIDRAVYEAVSGRFAPCWLDIPVDIQSKMINEDDLIEFNPPKNKIIFDAKTFQYIINKINSAKSPLIIAGHGIRLSGMIKEFKKVIQKINIPVVTTFNGFDIIETDNPYYIGRIGTVGQRAGNFALQNADLILCLGTRNNIRQVSYNWENFAKNAFKIVVDIDKSELDKPLVKPDIAFCCDLAEFIPKLHKNTEKTNCVSWLKYCQNLKEKYSFENYNEQTQKDKINPYCFTHILSKLLKENDTFVMANGSACVCTFQNAIVKNNQRYILNSGNASMGFGLPCAIGASYQTTGRIICLEGDGSIMMNIQELQTIKHNNLPIKLFVINNNGYSSIRQTQKRFFDGNMTGSGIDSGVSVPDFTKVAKAFGINALKIDNPNTMEDDIEKVLNYEGAILCELMCEEEYDFMPRLSSKKLDDGTIISTSLEDMYPFLSKNEMNKNMFTT